MDKRIIGATVVLLLLTGFVSAQNETKSPPSGNAGVGDLIQAIEELKKQNRGMEARIEELPRFVETKFEDNFTRFLVGTGSTLVLLVISGKLLGLFLRYAGRVKLALQKKQEEKERQKVLETLKEINQKTGELGAATNLLHRRINMLGTRLKMLEKIAGVYAPEEKPENTEKKQVNWTEHFKKNYWKLAFIVAGAGVITLIYLKQRGVI